MTKKIDESDNDGEDQPKPKKDSRVSPLLKKAKLTASNRLIVALDRESMSTTNVTSRMEHPVVFTSEEALTTEQVLEKNKGRRPARIPELCEWCTKRPNFIPYIVALGTTWRELGEDRQEWVGCAFQLVEERIFSGDRIKRVWLPGTSFLFFAPTEKSSAVH